MLASPVAMHIPDGFLTPLVAAVGWILALASLSLAVRRTQASLGERQVPMMGVLAAFIFAAQALNFPVAAGTSGHLLGGALAAILMGPWAAGLMMSAVVILQGLVFQDGGLLVMGWNMINMGFVTAFVGFAVFSLVRKVIRDRGSGPAGGRVRGSLDLRRSGGHGYRRGAGGFRDVPPQPGFASDGRRARVDRVGGSRHHRRRRRLPAGRAPGFAAAR